MKGGTNNIKKKIFKIFGKMPKETFGSFYTGLSSSRRGAERFVKRRYPKLKILR